jgi:hypothetical protein
MIGLLSHRPVGKLDRRDPWMLDFAASRFVVAICWTMPSSCPRWLDGPKMGLSVDAQESSQKAVAVAAVAIGHLVAPAKRLRRRLPPYPGAARNSWI